MNKFLSFSKLRILFLFGLLVCLCVFSYGQTFQETVKADTLSKSQAVETISPRFRVGAQIGYGCRVGPICRYMATQFGNIPKHRSNVSFGTDISYYLKNDIGFGIRYNGIYTSTSENYKFPLIGIGKVSKKIGIHHFGAFFGARYFLKQNRYCIFANAGVGYVGFRDNTSVFNESAKITGSSAAFYGEIGFDFLNTKYVAIGLQVSLCAGALGTGTFSIGDRTITEKLDNSLRESLTHIDISLGFRLYK